MAITLELYSIATILSVICTHYFSANSHIMSKNKISKIDGKELAKQGLKRSLGLFILFLCVTVPSCMALIQ